MREAVASVFIDICVQDYGSEWLSHHICDQEINRCHTKGESEESIGRQSLQMRGSTVAFKPRADVTRSPKQGFQWPH